MAFLLQNPQPQFFDVNGVPLDSGTLDIRDPNTDALINVYPTAADADAATNAITNPIVLNQRGEAPTGMFLPDGTLYKAELKDSSGTTVWTHTNIETPEDETRESIGLALYPQTAGEAAAGVTPTVYYYEPGDVRRYGAVGDGTADDTLAFQNALDSNDKVRVPKTANYYKITSELTVNTGNYVVGEGAYPQVTFDGSMAADSLFATTGSDVTIENLYLSGDTSVDAGDKDQGNAVVAIGGSRVCVRNCRVESFPQGGIRFRNILDGTVTGNFVANITPNATSAGSVGGISIEDNCNNIVVSENEVTLIGVTDGQETGIRCIRQNAGANNFPKHVSIIGNHVHEIEGHGIIMYAAAEGPVDSLASVISNNRIKNTGLSTTSATRGCGIYVVNVHSVSITGNYILNPSVNTGVSSIAVAGIAAMAAQPYNIENISIVGNHIVNAGQEGIRCQHLHYGVISDNVLNGFATNLSSAKGIYLSVFDDTFKFKNVTVTGNTFVGDTAAVEVFQHGTSGVDPTSENVFVEIYAPPTTGQQEALIRNHGTGCFVKSVATALPNSGDHAVGDIFINTAASPGEPAGWVCTVAGNPGTFVVSGQVGYRSGANTPVVDAVTPNFIGERYFDSTPSTGEDWYTATGATSSDWKKDSA